ncbi:glucosamine inositolphosphorylceramide transferase family protein [Derxia gummosa]|uniref:Glucosamine inositolphosphorylceramide transferase family protein n=1 Tax=Derxia gummosa DSM 723 TaxID=1121388 RepID=A0A8B6X983_9BURK|nr:hypothetical protein [Derxia gummosa]
MQRIQVIVPPGPLPAWVGRLLDRIQDAVPTPLLLVESATAPAGGLGWKLARRSLSRRFPGLAFTDDRDYLRRQPAARALGSSDLVIDLTAGCDASTEARWPSWRLVDERGRPVTGAFPGIDGISRDSVGSVFVVADSPGSSRVLRAARIATGPDWSRALERYLDCAANLLLQVLRDFKAGVPLQATGEVAPAQLSVPVLARLLEGKARALARKLGSLLLAESWMVGWIREPIGRVAFDERLGQRIEWLGQRSDDGYLADPFGLPGSTREFFAEYLDEHTGIGHLRRMKIVPDGLETVARFNPAGEHHVSFPFVFEAEGRQWAIAETASARECWLHELDERGNWVRIACILEGVAAADPIVFRCNGFYWLAYTDADRGAFDNLCLRYSESLTGPWHEHQNNPVLTDVRGARCGGTPFWHEGGLYRPAQDCSRTYGGAISLRRILVCTPDRYEEEIVRLWKPEPDDANPDGLHTVSAWGRFTLVDGKRMVVNPVVLRRKLMLRLRARRGARGG